MDVRIFEEETHILCILLFLHDYFLRGRTVELCSDIYFFGSDSVSFRVVCQAICQLHQMVHGLRRVQWNLFLRASKYRFDAEHFMPLSASFLS